SDWHRHPVSGNGGNWRRGLRQALLAEDCDVCGDLCRCKSPDGSRRRHRIPKADGPVTEPLLPGSARAARQGGDHGPKAARFGLHEAEIPGQKPRDRRGIL
ncbi:MAG: hypothetical protein ACK5PT_00810, partial [Cereibacter sp.]